MLSNPNLELPLHVSRDLSQLKMNTIARAPVIGEDEDFLLNCHDRDMIASLPMRDLSISVDVLTVNSHKLRIGREDRAPLQAKMYHRGHLSTVSMFEEPVPSMVLSSLSDGSGLYRADMDRENVRDMAAFNRFIDLTACAALKNQIYRKSQVRYT